MLTLLMNTSYSLCINDIPIPVTMQANFVDQFCLQGTPIKPLKSGDKVGFHWSREDGIIWLYINGIKAGLFMSGLRGYEVYPAISFQLVNTAVRISFNLPVPPARTAPAKSEAEPSLIVPQ